MRVISAVANEKFVQALKLVLEQLVGGAVFIYDPQSNNTITESQYVLIHQVSPCGGSVRFKGYKNERNKNAKLAELARFTNFKDLINKAIGYDLIKTIDVRDEKIDNLYFTFDINESDINVNQELWNQAVDALRSA